MTKFSPKIGSQFQGPHGIANIRYFAHKTFLVMRSVARFLCNIWWIFKLRAGNETEQLGYALLTVNTDRCRPQIGPSFSAAPLTESSVAKRFGFWQRTRGGTSIWLRSIVIVCWAWSTQDEFLYCYTVVTVWLVGRVVRTLDLRSIDREFESCSLSAIECNPGQVVNTHVPLSPSSIIWYQPMGGDALRLGR